MPSPRIAMLLAVCLSAMTAASQPLVCPPAPAGRPCDAFHYHVAMYRPDNKTFAEVYAASPFASQAACERAREQQVAANAGVVEFFRATKDQQYPADRLGGCHCDMTMERSSVTYLADAQRLLQLRTAEEVRLRVKERLLDRKALSDAPAIRGLYADPPGTPLLSGPKLVPPPQSAPASVAIAPADLQNTRTLDTARPAIVGLDLPLIDLTAGAAPAAAQPDAPVVAGEEVPSGTAVAAQTGGELPAPIEETRVEPQPEVVEPDDAPAEAEEEALSGEEIAESFISYETQRIQNVLRASSAIGDETVKTRIFEAAMERIQLLANLRSLIEGSGTGSRLAAAARDAVSEEQRMALVARLFGRDIQPHWAPKDASEVVFEADPAIADAPERALRDGTGGVTVEQRKQALYLVLARTQPTEDQRLWLSTVMEGFLR